VAFVFSGEEGHSCILASGMETYSEGDSLAEL